MLLDGTTNPDKSTNYFGLTKKYMDSVKKNIYVFDSLCFYGNNNGGKTGMQRDRKTEGGKGLKSIGNSLGRIGDKVSPRRKC